MILNPRSNSAAARSVPAPVMAPKLEATPHAPTPAAAIRAKPADTAPAVPTTPRPPDTILRFRGSERFLHWSLAIPFVLLYGSALLMFAFWGEPAPRLLRAAFGLAHRLAGLLLMVLPPLALFWGSPDWRVHARNMREGWVWTWQDVRWLVLFPRNALDARVALPEQGKFNAAEKLNFMMVSSTYPLYIATGILIWVRSGTFAPWVAHAATAVLGIPLVGGHIFMATVNPATRIGLSGMITGRVDRAWAKHHYRRWYREHFERPDEDSPRRPVAPLLKRPAAVRCESCHALHAFESWEALLQRVFQVEPLFCPRCHAEIRVVSAVADQAVANAILAHLELGDPSQPFSRISELPRKA